MAKQGNGSAPKEMPAADDSSKPVHVMDLIKQFDFLSIGLTGKIHCALTNRDLPLNSTAVHQHLNSKKLKKEREWYNADFSKYEPFVVAHKTNPKLLFCTLTRIELNRIPKEVEAHVNGKRYGNRKAEMEGLKQAQRQPLGKDSEEEDQEEDGAEVWVPTGGAEAMDEDGESDQEEDEEEEDDDDEAEEGGAGDGVKRAPRREDKGQSAAREGRQKKSGKKGKADKTKRKAEGGREDGDDGGQQNGSSSGGQGAKGQAEKKKGGAKNIQRGGKGPAKLAAKSPKPSPRSDDTPAVSKTVVRDAAPASSPSSSSKKAKKKAKTPKKSAGGEAPPKENGVVGGAPPAAAQPAAKRKHKVSDEPTSSGKKKRKS